MESKYITIDGVEIHYQTCGNGPSNLLLIHGAVGSTNDFNIQMADEKFGLSRDEFTIVAYDMPGLGKSKEFETLKTLPTLDYFEASSQIGAKLMAKLGYKTYAIAGWSDGARVAALLAIEHQSRVDALVLWGFMSVMDKKSSYAIARTRDIRIWDKKALETYSSVYGEQEFSDLWHQYVDYIIAALELPGQFDISEELKKIKCPTLILYGTNDPIVDYEEHVKPLSMQIYDSDIKKFKGMAHNIHQANPAQFNQELITFVTSLRA